MVLIFLLIIIHIKKKDYVSFKTRMNPVIRDGKWGGFLSLWIEYIKENSWVEDVINKNSNYNLSFELYGYRNPLTITYQVPLEVSLLFGISREVRTKNSKSIWKC